MKVIVDSTIPDPESRFSWMPVSVNYIDGKNWALAHDVEYRTVIGLISTIRLGFVFDWASTPAWLWPICPPAGMPGSPYGIAALWHDWLYRHHKIEGKLITRKEADDIFLEIMLYLGVSSWRAHIMWAAVRTFGSHGW